VVIIVDDSAATKGLARRWQACIRRILASANWERSGQGWLKMAGRFATCCQLWLCWQVFVWHDKQMTWQGNPEVSEDGGKVGQKRGVQSPAEQGGPGEGWGAVGGEQTT